MEYGLPKQKKYPLNSPKRVVAARAYAVKNWHLYSPAERRELRHRIEAAAKKYGIRLKGGWPRG